MKRTITVLQDDIDNGCKRDSENCAVARAANRDLADLLGEGYWVGVSNACVTVWASAVRLAYMAQLPAEATSFISAFDNDERVEPFKFEVELEESRPAE